MGFAYDSFSREFALFRVLFCVAFVAIMAVILVQIVRGISQWGRNNRSPRLTVEASVAAKRTNVITHHRHGTDNMLDSTSTSYYATFQVESGDRMEFSLSGAQYGMLAEGDRGRLRFQGTRFLGFERI